MAKAATARGQSKKVEHLYGNGGRIMKDDEIVIVTSPETGRPVNMTVVEALEIINRDDNQVGDIQAKGDDSR